MKKRIGLKKAYSMAVCMLCTLCMLLVTACAGNGRGKPENQNEAEQAFREAKAAGKLSDDENTITQESQSTLEKDTEERTGKQTREKQVESAAESTENTGISQRQENADPDSTKGEEGKNNQKTAKEKGQDNNKNNSKDDTKDASVEKSSNISNDDSQKNSSGKLTESPGNSSNTSPDLSKENPANTAPDPSQDTSVATPSAPTPDLSPSHTVCTWDSGRILQEVTCTEAGRKLYTCTQCGKEKEERIPATGHRMEEQWFGDMPTCDRGSYLNIVCSVCGFVQSSESVPALGCVSDAGEELFHGNCREETIVVYHCIRCGRETGYDRHYEPDEHDWITARTDPEWDEEAFDFVSREVTCCSRCGIEKGVQ